MSLDKRTKACDAQVDITGSAVVFAVCSTTTRTDESNGLYIIAVAIVLSNVMLDISTEMTSVFLSLLNSSQIFTLNLCKTSRGMYLISFLVVVVAMFKIRFATKMIDAH